MYYIKRTNGFNLIFLYTVALSDVKANVRIIFYKEIYLFRLFHKDLLRRLSIGNAIMCRL